MKITYNKLHNDLSYTVIIKPTSKGIVQSNSPTGVFNMNVKIKGIEEYDLDNDEKTKFTLVTFDFTTAKGTVELHENVNFGYNDYIYVEKVDSNVRCNEDDLYKSIVSEDDDFCIGDVLEAVEKEINNRKKYTVKDAKGKAK